MYELIDRQMRLEIHHCRLCVTYIYYYVTPSNDTVKNNSFLNFCAIFIFKLIGCSCREKPPLTQEITWMS